MAINQKLVKHGTAGGVDINVDYARIGHADAPTKVTLSANYSITHDPGMLFRPQFTGASPANLEYPRTITNGTTLTLHKAEADALVAAGKAAYA